MKTWTTPTVEELDVKLTAFGQDEYGWESQDWNDRSWLFWLCDQCKNKGEHDNDCNVPGCGNPTDGNLGIPS